MTGPEHYQYAESLVEDARMETDGGPEQTAMLARAQVHATLALAAATALMPFAAVDSGSDDSDLIGWSKTAGASHARLEAAQEYVKARGDYIASQH